MDYRANTTEAGRAFALMMLMFGGLFVLLINSIGPAIAYAIALAVLLGVYTLFAFLAHWPLPGVLVVEIALGIALLLGFARTWRTA